MNPTPLTMDGEREAFEAFAAANEFNIDRDESDKYREYHRATTRWLWMGWTERARRAALAATERPAEMPDTSERFIAIRESHRNRWSQSFFEARPHLDTPENNRIYYGGFNHGYDARVDGNQAATQPSSAMEPTDAQILKLWQSIPVDEGDRDLYVFARAVLALAAPAVPYKASIADDREDVFAEPAVQATVPPEWEDYSRWADKQMPAAQSAAPAVQSYYDEPADLSSPDADAVDIFAGARAIVQKAAEQPGVPVAIPAPLSAAIKEHIKNQSADAVDESYTLEEIATACMLAEVPGGQYEAIEIALSQSAAAAKEKS